MISAGDLGSSTLIALDALVKVSKELGLGKTSWPSYQVALTRDTMTMMHLELEHQDLDELSWTIAKRKSATEHELHGMKSLLETMRLQRDTTEKKRVRQWQQETEALKAETQRQETQYEQTMENTMSKIDDATITNIRLLETQTMELENQLDQMNNQLEQYHDMPQDMELCKMQMQDKMDILNNLEKRRERLLEDIARSMY